MSIGADLEAFAISGPSGYSKSPQKNLGSHWQPRELVIGIPAEHAARHVGAIEIGERRSYLFGAVGIQLAARSMRIF